MEKLSQNFSLNIYVDELYLLYYFCSKALSFWAFTSELNKENGSFLAALTLYKFSLERNRYMKISLTYGYAFGKSFSDFCCFISLEEPFEKGVFNESRNFSH